MSRNETLRDKQGRYAGSRGGMVPPKSAPSIPVAVADSPAAAAQQRSSCSGTDPRLVQTRLAQLQQSLVNRFAQLADPEHRRRNPYDRGVTHQHHSGDVRAVWRAWAEAARQVWPHAASADFAEAPDVGGDFQIGLAVTDNEIRVYADALPLNPRRKQPAHSVRFPANEAR